MNTCPNCAERIGYGAIAFSLLPIWIRCPNCKTRLVGNHLVQVLGLAEGLLVAGLMAAILSLIPFSLRLNAGAMISISPLAIPVGLAVLLLITRPIGAFLVLRYGRYAVRDEGQGTPQVLHRYLFATGIVSVVLLAWLILYADVNPAGIGTLVLWAFVPLLLLYPRYDLRLGHRVRKVAAFTLLLWAGIISVSAIVFTVYAIANYPKEQPFEEQLTLSLGPRSEQDAWNKFMVLIGDFENRFPRTSDNATDELSKATEQDRDHILQFLAQNVVSWPEEDLTPARGHSIRLMRDIARLEIIEIENLIDAGSEAAANEKYLRLWRVADNLVSGKSFLVQYLAGESIVSELIDFYMDGDNRTHLPSDGGLLNMTVDIRSKLDDAYVNAFTNMYHFAGDVLVHDREAGCRALMAQGLCILELPWPFYDEYESLGVIYDQLVKLIALSRQPFHSIESDLASFSQELDSRMRVSILKNPVGSIVVSQWSSVDYRPILYSKERTKAKLLVLQYVVESSESGHFDGVPLDPLTGEPFVVIDKGDTIEIRSDGEPTVRYEITKNRQ